LYSRARPGGCGEVFETFVLARAPEGCHVFLNRFS
jgi:hypothetical protein